MANRVEPIGWLAVDQAVFDRDRFSERRDGCLGVVACRRNLSVEHCRRDFRQRAHRIESPNPQRFEAWIDRDRAHAVELCPGLFEFPLARVRDATRVVPDRRGIEQVRVGSGLTQNLVPLPEPYQGVVGNRGEVLKHRQLRFAHQ